MYNYIRIKVGNSYRIFRLDFSKNSPSCSMCVENVCVIHTFKNHDHDYQVKCFFYETQCVFYKEHIRSKRELVDLLNQLIEAHI